MDKERIQKLIDEYFNTQWYIDDFIAGYQEAKDIDGKLTEEEEADFESQLTAENLKNFREVIIQEINERIPYLFN